MRSLADLLASADGRQLLESRGAVLDEASFVGELRPPFRPGLGALVGLDSAKLPVYTAHQLLADYQPSVLSKITAAATLGRRYPQVAAVLVWLDLDRAGADKGAAAIQLFGRGGNLQIRLAPRRHDDKEIRFVPVDRGELEAGLRRMRAWARQHGAAVAARFSSLEEAALEANPVTLAELNVAVTSFLLQQQLQVQAPSVLVSELMARGLLTDAVEEVVNRIDDVITVFNAAVDGLVAADVDPQVRPLRPGYLPLHYSCDRDDRRCSLVHDRQGDDHFAATTCVCGTTYRFHLGTTTLSIGELAATNRWSTDVTLPLYLGALTSGLVAGRSSALYGFVLNEVSEKVLGRRPVPMLIPQDLGAVLAGDSGTPGAHGNSLLAQYLAGG